MHPELIGEVRNGRRRLFVLESADARIEPPELAGARAPFIALLAVDDSEAMAPLISDWMNRLIDAGCTTVHAWGRDATRIDDLGDFALLERFDFDVPDDEVFNTTWLDSRTGAIGESIFQVLECGVVPEPHDARDCDVVAIALGMPEDVVREIRSAFADPRAWVERFCADE